MAPTPAEEVRPLVRQLVVAWKTLLSDLRGGGMRGAAGLLLWRWAALWERERPIPAPFDKVSPVPMLEELLRSDVHLQATCRDAGGLAKALDIIALEQVADEPSLLQQENALERITDYLVAALFEAEYERRVYFRFYNLQTEESPLDLPGTTGQLEQLEDWQIPDITGESTPVSRLHVPDTGNVFLIFSDKNPDEDNAWWQARWNDATSLVGVFKYLKSEVIEVDYSAIQFSPEWLNRVRRFGVTLWGLPRRDVQARRYTLSRGEDQTLARYIAAATQFKPLLEDLSPTLRRAIATAGDYYEGHHRRTSLNDQLVDLVIALEALFSPSSGTELQFRIAHQAALLLGGDAESRIEIAEFTRKVYRARSGLVHEGKSPFVERGGPPALGVGDVQRLADLLRQAILRLSILYARERPSRERALKELENCAYDPAALDSLRRRTDLEVFLGEQGL